jgi:uncharacterized protein (DUF58 family)
MIDKLLKKSEYKSLEILSKEALEGLFHGKHKSILHGFSSEFKEFKSYEQGENPRNIDWKLFGKTDKLYTKTYQDETNIKVYFILDISSSMYFPIDSNEKINKAVQIVATLSTILQKQKDSFGVIFMSDDLTFESKLGHSLAHLKYIYQALENLIAENSIKKKTGFPDLIKDRIESLGAKKKIYFISDLMFTEVENLTFIQSMLEIKALKNEVEILYMVDPSEITSQNSFSNYMNIEDKETDEILSIHIDHFNETLQKMHELKYENLISKLTQKGIKTHLLSVEQPLINLVKQII